MLWREAKSLCKLTDDYDEDFDGKEEIYDNQEVLYRNLKIQQEIDNVFPLMIEDDLPRYLLPIVSYLPYIMSNFPARVPGSPHLNRYENCDKYQWEIV
jgi:arginine/lysine/ornithine decarboxylase